MSRDCQSWKIEKSKTMKHAKTTIWATLLTLAPLLATSLLPAAIAAAPVVSTGPEDSVAVSGDWQSLSPGESHWYAFDYHGHHNFPEAKDEDEEAPDPVFVSSDVGVSLHAEPDGGASFGIWTEEQVGLWAEGEEFEPIRQGLHTGLVGDVELFHPGAGGFQINCAVRISRGSDDLVTSLLKLLCKLQSQATVSTGDQDNTIFYRIHWVSPFKR